MKSIVSLFAGVCFAALSLAPVAAAQSSDIVRFHLSDPAMVGTVQLPAGDYEVRVLESVVDSNTVIFQSHNFTATVMATKTFLPKEDWVDNSTVTLERVADHLAIQRINVSSRDYRWEFAVVR